MKIIAGLSFVIIGIAFFEVATYFKRADKAKQRLLFYFVMLFIWLGGFTIGHYVCVKAMQNKHVPSEVTTMPIDTASSNVTK